MSLILQKLDLKTSPPRCFQCHESIPEDILNSEQPVDWSCSCGTARFKCDVLPIRKNYELACHLFCPENRNNILWFDVTNVPGGIET